MSKASKQDIDFSFVEDNTEHASGVPGVDPEGGRARPLTPDGKIFTPKQLRARMRRKQARRVGVTDEEIEQLYQKPIADWDLEELARGRPRNSRGTFQGPKPKWITMAMHEESMRKYEAAVKGNMRETTVDALQTLRDLLADESVDEKGKPTVGAGTKVDIAKFLIEHSVGKPTQKIEGDMSVRLQGILGTVMVNPAELATGNYMPAHFPGMTMELSTGETAVDDDADLIPRSEG